MKPRLRIRRALGVMIILGLFLFTPSSANARSDRHYYCEGRARDYARRNTSGGTFKGAAKGAVAGAIIGAIAGDVGEGAAIGAGIGAVGGTVRRAESKDRLYQQEYDRCMRRYRR
jgi:uncharacterized protein YcfJ